MEIKKESKPTTSLLFDGWGSLAVAVATGALTVKYLIQYDPKNWVNLTIWGLLSVLCTICFVRFIYRKFSKKTNP
ncbi:hypothetical protein [Acetobacteroides hydrogenigenes]|uniref:Uncharacterized protein n=1 Tax=Acetobacteroides hydrogenigenes TaxID=979970 RepID=A0A4R2E468_9BACT|nr:hypothetical protein [Acetobacteroides hydrogenigenes]TCN63068.1 hypothetical protein CLV25_11646 [Acetobacteroides hydrogenigenes]